MEKKCCLRKPRSAVQTFRTSLIDSIRLAIQLVRRSKRAALAVKKRQGGIDQLRCDAHFVVRDVRQDRQAILRHVLTLPTGILQSTAEQLVELPEVLPPVHVTVDVYEDLLH